MSRYVGIDESNHGRENEVYVLLGSNNFEDIQEKSYKNKRRIWSDVDDAERLKELENLIKDRNLKYITIDWGIRNLLHDREIQTIILLEAIRLFRPESIFFDGIIDSKIIKQVKRKKRGIYEIHSGAKFDTKYPIVHAADTLANRIYREVTNRKASMDDGIRDFLREHLVAPDWGKYAKKIKN